MTDRVEFFVHGTPAPQGSHSAMKIGDRAVVVAGSSTGARLKHAAWRNAVSEAALRQEVFFDEPVAVRLGFVFASIKSAPYRHLHVSPPDADKLARSCLDSLVAAGSLRDDSLVADLRVTKRYAEFGEPAGCLIEIVGMGEEDEVERQRRKDDARSRRKNLHA